MKTIKFKVVKTGQDYDVPFMLIDKAYTQKGVQRILAKSLFGNFTQVVQFEDSKTGKEIQTQIDSYKDDGSPVLFVHYPNTMVHPVGNDIVVYVYANQSFQFTLPEGFTCKDIDLRDEAYLTKQSQAPVKMFEGSYSISDKTIDISIKPTEYFEFKATGKPLGVVGNRSFNNGRRHCITMTLVANIPGYYEIGEGIAGNSFLIES